MAHTHTHSLLCAVLEFELRKAYETIKSLRSSLTEASGGLGQGRGQGRDWCAFLLQRWGQQRVRRLLGSERLVT